LEVASFYSDLQSSIQNVADVVKPDGYACYVVGNRKVKGVVLPTDQVIRDFFETCGFEYVATYHRSIPNKRMPSRNSPTNATGFQIAR
jgi:site-specific DNA-methyltransferase (cytosine-N4-specific)